MNFYAPHNTPFWVAVGWLPWQISFLTAIILIAIGILLIVRARKTKTSSAARILGIFLVLLGLAFASYWFIAQSFVNLYSPPVNMPIDNFTPY